MNINEDKTEIRLSLMGRNLRTILQKLGNNYEVIVFIKTLLMFHGYFIFLFEFKSTQ